MAFLQAFKKYPSVISLVSETSTLSLTGLLDTVSCQVQVLSYIQNNLIALEVAHGVERGKARRMETSEFLLNKFLRLGTAILHMSQKIYFLPLRQICLQICTNLLLLDQSALLLINVILEI